MAKLNNKIKILYLITQSGFGGAQKNVFDLAVNLDAGLFDVAVAAGPDGDYQLNNRLDQKGIRNFRLKHLRRPINPFRDLRAFFEILKLLKKERPDVLHLHSSKAGVLGALAPLRRSQSARPKVVYTVHGAVFEAEFQPFSKKIFLWLEKFSALLKDKIICVSQKDKNLWLKYRLASPQKITAIHNGLDWQYLQNLFLSKERVKEIFTSRNAALFEAFRDASAELKIIGTIANFYPEKGLFHLIEALNVIFKKIPDAIFVHLGYGPRKELIETMIKDYGLEKKIFLLGAPENFGEKLEAAAYLKFFDIFVLPSLKEGFPYAILEAMAAGLPIVASYVGGIPEMIANGENGFLVPTRNPDMLAEKIIELLQNPVLTQKFSRASLEKIKEFSLEKMVKETEQIYQNV